MSAAAHADLLFVKEMANGDSDLATYCMSTLYIKGQSFAHRSMNLTTKHRQAERHRARVFP